MMETAAFEQVLSKCLEGGATDDEQRQLVEAVRTSRVHAERMSLEVVIDSSLRTLRRDPQEFFAVVQARLRHQGGSARFSAQMRQRIERQQRAPAGRRRSFWSAALPMAALVAIGIIITVVATGRDRTASRGAGPVSMAMVSEVSGHASISIEGKPQKLSVGMPFPAGSAVTTGTDGVVVLRLRDGSQIEIRHDTSLTSSEDALGKRLELASGTIVAQVAKQDPMAPMRVLAPGVEATVVGTRFGMWAGPRGSRLEVTEGHVRYRRTSDDATLDVLAGQSAVCTDDVPFAVRPSRNTKRLLMLCLFNEGSGRVIHDVSGVGDPIDFTIGNTAEAVWTAHGLLMPRHRAEISFTGRAAKISDALARHRGLTFEFWVDSHTSRPMDVTTTTLRMFNPYFTSDTYMKAGREAKGLQFIGMTFSEKDGHLLLSTYDDGPNEVKDVGNAESLIASTTHDPSMTIQLWPDQPATQGTISSEIRLLAIYGGAMTEAEIRRDEAAGLPQEAPLDPVSE